MVAAAQDLVFRASMQNNMKKGAEEVRSEINRLGKEAGEAVEKAKREIEQKAGAHGIWGRVFSDQSTTGLNPLQRALGIGAGGMAVGAFAVIGKTLADSSAKLLEFNSMLREGKLDASGMVVELGKTIPLAGSFFQVGANIRELLTSEKANLELQRELHESIVGLHEQEYVWALKNVEATKARANELAKLERQQAAVGLRGSEVERRGYADRAKEITEGTAADVLAIRNKGKTDPEIDAAQDKLKKWREAHGEEMRLLSMTSDTTSGNVPGGAAGAFGSGQAVAINSKNNERLKELKDAEAELKAEADRVTQKHRYAAQMEEADRRRKGEKEGAINEAQRQEFEKRRKEELEIQAGSHGAEIKYSSEMSTAQGERTAGNQSAAKRREIMAKAAKDDADAYSNYLREWNAAGTAEEKDLADKRILDVQAANRAKLAAALAEEAKETGEEKRKAAFEAGEAQKDAEAEVTAGRLRKQGEGYEAERTLRKRELDRRLDEIDEAAREEIARNKDNAPAIMAKAKADKDAAKARYSEDDRRAGESEVAGKFGTARQLAGQMKDSLDLRARGGDIRAAVEGKKLEVSEKYAGKRFELEKIARDPNATAQQKAIAQQQLGNLGAEQAKEEKLSTFAGGGVRMAGLTMSAGGSGRAARANEEMSAYNRLRAATADGGGAGGKGGAADAGKQWDAMVKILGEIKTELSKSAGAQPKKSEAPGYNYQHR